MSPATSSPATSSKETARTERPNPLDRLYTWPHFLIIEFVGLMVFTLGLFLIAVLFYSPLGELAEATQTPNPSKAPWYFMSLQELLLHMNPSLAGVIVPTAVLVLFAAIPYLDKDERGTAIWFTTRKGVEIFRYSFLYTTVWLVALILFDEFIGVRPLLAQVGITGELGEIIGGILIPTLIMVGIYVLLDIIIRRRWTSDLRHRIIGHFTVVVASLIILTIIGTSFRGEDMLLVWPWEITDPH